MEDDKLRILFDEYDPELPSDDGFISRLQQNLDTVEIIRRHAVKERSRNKKAVVMASFVGFVVGFLFSLSLPYLSNVVSDWRLTLPGNSMLGTLANNFMVLAWLLIGCTSVLASLNSYEIILSLLKKKS